MNFWISYLRSTWEAIIGPSWTFRTRYFFKERSSVILARCLQRICTSFSLTQRWGKFFKKIIRIWIQIQQNSIPPTLLSQFQVMMKSDRREEVKGITNLIITQILTAHYKKNLLISRQPLNSNPHKPTTKLFKDFTN